MVINRCLTFIQRLFSAFVLLNAIFIISACKETTCVEKPIPVLGVQFSLLLKTPIGNQYFTNIPSDSIKAVVAAGKTDTLFYLQRNNGILYLPLRNATDTTTFTFLFTNGTKKTASIIAKRSPLLISESCGFILRRINAKVGTTDFDSAATLSSTIDTTMKPNVNLFIRQQ